MNTPLIVGAVLMCLGLCVIIVGAIYLTMTKCNCGWKKIVFPLLFGLGTGLLVGGAVQFSYGVTPSTLSKRSKPDYVISGCYLLPFGVVTAVMNVFAFVCNRRHGNLLYVTVGVVSEFIISLGLIAAGGALIGLGY